ncbi:hypothetical protein BGZ46_001227 [Entomortierella lignicola]|nr:hypothetical protein BGZ46_001227 [Entomortierella lignicola]
MTFPSSTTETSQAFRDRSSSNIITIPTRSDSEKQQIILWADVLHVFPNAKTVLNGNVAVVFMTDVNFNYLTPLRIRHYPGVVLDVVAGCTEKGVVSVELSTTPQTAKQESQPNNYNPRHDNQKKLGPLTNEIVSTLTTLDQKPEEYTEITVWGPDNNIDQSSFQDIDPAVTKYRPRTGSIPMSPLEYHRYYSSYLHDIMDNQVVQSSSIKDAMVKHFDEIQDTMQKNAALQVQVYQMQQRMEEKQQKMIEMQKLALDRLTIIQNHVQSMLTQPYEVHENPTPRLFIVLPKAIRQRNHLGDLLPNQFKLYFLCECGRHTMTTSSKTHEVHIAKHEGYDLEQPTDFFEKFGSYLLTLMQMFKYGCITSGLIVPSLEKFRNAEEAKTIQWLLEGKNDTIGTLVDETISYLEEHYVNTTDGSDPGTASNSDQLMIPNSADMAQLRSYLGIKDEHRPLGNLFRIITSEGYVKWVCLDHYRENYRESPIRSLKEIVEGNGGTILEEEGRVNIDLATCSEAKHFYEAMIKAQRVQELIITLKWNAHMDDLRKLASAVLKANVTHITIDGVQFKGPTRDVINRGRRYDPIIQLMSNGRIRSLKVKNFQGFYSHISGSSIKLAPNLRVLWIDSKIKTGEKSFVSCLGRILENTPSLTELRLTPSQPIALIELIQKKFNKTIRFEHMNLNNVGKDPEIYMEFTRLASRSSSMPSMSPLTNGRSRKEAGGGRVHSLTLRLGSSNWDDNNHILAIFRSYGWSIKDLELDMPFDDSLTSALCDPISNIDSKLTSFSMNTEGLSKSGLDDLLQVLDRSQTLQCLDLKFDSLHDQTRLDKLKTLLQGQEKILRSLTLTGASPNNWISALATLFPSALCFPKLRSLQIICKGEESLSRASIEWISLIVSSPSQGISSPPSPYPLGYQGSPRLSTHLLAVSAPQSPSRSPRLSLVDPIPGSPRLLAPPVSPRLSSISPLTLPLPEPPRSLKEFVLDGPKIQPEDWAMIIKSFNFNHLEKLGFPGTNFSLTELKFLISCFPEEINGGLVTLKSLDLHQTKLSGESDIADRQNTLDRLQKSIICKL